MLNIVEHIKKTGERTKAFIREEIKKLHPHVKHQILDGV